MDGESQSSKCSSNTRRQQSLLTPFELTSEIVQKHALRYTEEPSKPVTRAVMRFSSTAYATPFTDTDHASNSSAQRSLDAFTCRLGVTSSRGEM